MSVQFLVPLFLAGLAAVVIPILVHLTRKQKARIVEFPSLMFLDRVPFQAESRRRIHHWLLLLLRGLVIAATVAAFSRPFFADDGGTVLSGSGPSEVVVLLDRSYSMGIQGRWEQAVDAARGVFHDLGPLDRASLAVFGSQAAVVVRSSSDRNRLLAALDTLRPGFESTSYGPGLKLAQTILDETDLPSGKLVLVGDLQRTGWTGDHGVVLPPGSLVTPVPIGEGPAENLAVSGVDLDRERLQGRDRISPVARITRVGGESPGSFDVILELEGREMQRRRLELPAEGADVVSFDPINITQDHTRGAVRIDSGDPLSPDDVHFFVLSPGRAISVLILDGSGRTSASSLFLREALAISEDRGFEVSVRREGQMGSGALDGVDVLVVNDRALSGGETADAIRAHVEDGGGLLVVLGEGIRWPSDLSDLLPGSFTQPQDRRVGSGGRLGHIDYQHPVFEIFRGPRGGDFATARFFRSRTVQVPEGDTVSVLARFDDGTPALIEKDVGEGRVMVWTSTMDTYWTDLPQRPVFLPFVHRLIAHTSGRAEAVPFFTAGQVLDVSNAAAMELAGLGDVGPVLNGPGSPVVLAPNGETRSFDGPEGERFLHLDHQGVFDIRTSEDPDVRPVAVAVNVDLTEGDLEALDPEELTASLIPWSPEAVVEAERAGLSGMLQQEDRERRQSLWRFLLLMALVLLAAEALVSARLSRPVGKGGIHAGP